MQSGFHAWFIFELAGTNTKPILPLKVENLAVEAQH